jgi:hypothetical protein
MLQKLGFPDQSQHHAALLMQNLKHFQALPVLLPTSCRNLVVNVG